MKLLFGAYADPPPNIYDPQKFQRFSGCSGFRNSNKNANRIMDLLDLLNGHGVQVR